MHTGDKIKLYRKEKGLSQEQLAQQIGVTKSTVSKYELGHLDISLEVLHKIADILEVPFF